MAEEVEHGLELCSVGFPVLFHSPSKSTPPCSFTPRQNELLAGDLRMDSYRVDC